MSAPSTPAPATTDPRPAATAASPTARQLWRSARGMVAAGVLLVLAALVLAALMSGHRVGYLDPDSVSGSGSRAVAQLLRGQGVDVVRAEGVAAATTAAHAGDTLVLSQPDLLTVEQAREMASTDADLVVVGARRPDIVSALARDLTPHEAGLADVHPPACTLDTAVRAGDALSGNVRYAVDPDALDTVGCYPVGGDPTVVSTRHDGQRVVLIGASGPLENDHLGQDGNAALALGLLGERATVVWHVPSVADLAQEEQKSFWQLVPTWVKVLLVQLAVGVLLLALWRARRLGPVVAEPLPVVVRAAEATEGRGRLYRRSGDRGAAADRLRSATRSRLAPLLGLPRRPDPAAMVDAASARSGRPAADVHVLLYGGPPPDDGALARLADDLDALERQVRRP